MPFRGGTGDDWYGFDCECGSMDRRDQDGVDVDLTGLPEPGDIDIAGENGYDVLEFGDSQLP
ncbi:MAG: hypothetical protein QF719_06885 [Chloroflexota bacterium]|nr:hypothetical protein [Chloroflexota bacterium]MDP6509162.1 hypothetical protein [Chloroflexota bacterium]MDP6757921.1 hypothetical protein [Chloroflexota bacterium]